MAMCLVNNFETPTKVETDVGDAIVTMHEKEPRSFGIGLATIHTCAILAALLEAQDRGVKIGDEFTTSEFCKECSGLVRLTIVPTNYEYQ